VALLGGSKGGEAALLVASRNPGVCAVVAMTPAAHSFEGQTMRFFSPGYQPVASWSLGGRPYPFVPLSVTAEIKETYMKGGLTSFVPFYRDGLIAADPELLERATIRVEKIRGPILLISGSDDQCWPAGDFCGAILARLKKTGFTYSARHVSIDGGGHTSCVPWLITANHGLPNDGDPSGGTPRANASGGYLSWAEILAFLHRHHGR
jgi:hypothetical protein